MKLAIQFLSMKYILFVLNLENACSSRQIYEDNSIVHNEL